MQIPPILEYDPTMSTLTTNNVQPKAVMTPDEQAVWDALPAAEQLTRLRSAVQRGIDSGPSDLTMDQIWSKLRARHANAKL